MAVKKLDNNFYEETNYRLSNSSQLKLFNLLQDIETKEKFMNIFNAYIINEDISDAILYEYYDVGNDEWWENISYKIYGTQFLWWILPMINDIINPFETLEEGSQIKILKSKFIYKILKEIRNIGDL